MTNYRDYVDHGHICTVDCVDGEERISCLYKECHEDDMWDFEELNITVLKCNEDFKQTSQIIMTTCNEDGKKTTEQGEVAIVHARQFGNTSANDFDDYQHQVALKKILTYGLTSETSDKFFDLVSDFYSKIQEQCMTNNQTVLDDVKKSWGILLRCDMIEQRNHPRCFRNSNVQEANMQCMRTGMVRRIIAATNLKDIVTFNAADCRDFEGIFECMKNETKKKCKNGRVITIWRSIYRAAYAITHCTQNDSVARSSRTNAPIPWTKAPHPYYRQ
ncbi:hypothetical protein B566_EDAN016167 [Ephemera danica]|nr:hypothetical protein B566_EDAN016167 [Ephemera danica]